MNKNNFFVITTLTLTLVLIFSFVVYFSWNGGAVIVENTPAKPIEVKRQSVVQEPIRLLFVGDIMLDRGVALHAKKYGTSTLFSKIEPLLADNDAVVGNLEGAITNFESASQKNTSLLKFTFDPEFASLLRKLNFQVLSLANNHALDYGGEGYRQTFEYLRAAGIAGFGSPSNDTNLSTKINLRNKNLCFVGYHELYISDTAKILEEIKNIRPGCDQTVVMTHWGAEYEHLPTASQRAFGRSFIDAGADMVIGAHPHVVQPFEIYKNKAIFYSLGNFIFDQDFSYATGQGLAVQVVLGDEKSTFNLVPITIKRAEVSVAGSEDSQRTIDRLIASGFSEEQKVTIRINRGFVLED